LQKARRAARLSQNELARRARVHPQTISTAERSGAVSRALAAKLAPFLGVEAKDLLEPRRDDRGAA
jgi:transcriptional regulator with XRE-family HTH domain